MNSGSFRPAVSSKNCLSAAACALLVSLGCAHVVVHARKGEVAGEVKARLVLVAPVDLRWEEPSSLLSYARSLDVEEAVCRGARLATLGAGELAQLPGGESSPNENDVSRVALKSGVPVGEIVLLAASAERREQRSSVNLDDAKGKAAGMARDAQVTLVARVELSLPAMHLMLAEASAEEQIDPGADHPLLDAQPELAALLRRATDEAFAVLGKSLAQPPAIELGLRTLPAAAAALGYASPRGKSFAQSIGAQDSLEQEVSRDAALDLLAHAGPPLHSPSGSEEPIPPLAKSERRAFRASARGLTVVEARGRARASGLLPGDQILELDGLPATHPCAPLRAAQLSGAGVKAVVQRGSETKTIGL